METQLILSMIINYAKFISKNLKAGEILFLRFLVHEKPRNSYEYTFFMLFVDYNVPILLWNFVIVFSAPGYPGLSDQYRYGCARG